MQGIHIIADLKQIDFQKLELTQEKLKVFFSEVIKKHKLTELGAYYHTFGKQNEVTGVIALAESHVTFHTWPEFKYISIDIFVCNLKHDNTLKAESFFEKIVEFFGAGEVEKKIIERRV